MGISCLMGHKWSGCKCTKCSRTRNINHAWKGCKCTVCDQTRDEGHSWSNSVCTVCGKVKPVETRKEAEKTNPNQVRILERKADGGLHESSGNEAMAGPIFSLAYEKYSRVMSASKRNSISYTDEKDLDECIGLLDTVIELWPRYGEPFGLKGNMYFIRGQINRSMADLNQAMEDFRKGLEIGAKDASNHAIWRNAIEQVQTVKKMI